eukprot:12034418-Karenia_brevis.AAC.1
MSPVKTMSPDQPQLWMLCLIMNYDTCLHKLLCANSHFTLICSLVAVERHFEGLPRHPQHNHQVGQTCTRAGVMVVPPCNEKAQTPHHHHHPRTA